jgi:SAM-dependent methyltransferase
MTRDRYCLPQNYITRPEPIFHDDTTLKDEYQKEVYAEARDYYDRYEFNTVLDLGCGSAFKLLKYFPEALTIGVDLPSTVDWLRRNHTERAWRDWDDGPTNAELVICADMIEHVKDPDEVINFIERCKPTLIVISTPDRSLLEKGKEGPPNNEAHVREWTFDEFGEYLRQRWVIIDQKVVNYQQSTQVAVCRL